MGLGRQESQADALARGGSDNFRRIVDAMLDGTPVSSADREALTEDERAELASLVRTAHLTRVVLHQEDPSPAAEQAALDRAQSQLQTRLASGIPPTANHPAAADGRGAGGGGLRGWIDRLLGRGGDDQ